jgi:hypothetical protein
MPVIPVHKVVDPKRIIGKIGEGGEAQGVADPKRGICMKRQILMSRPN